MVKKHLAYYMPTWGNRKESIRDDRDGIWGHCTGPRHGPGTMAQASVLATSMIIMLAPTRGLPFTLTWGPEELPSHLDSSSENPAWPGARPDSLLHVQKVQMLREWPLF